MRRSCDANQKKRLTANQQLAASAVKRTKQPRVSIAQMTPALIVLCGFVVLFFTVTGNHGLLHLRDLNNEVRALNDKTISLRSDIIDVNNKIFALQQSPFTLEKTARETLSLARKGEIAYVFPASEQKANEEVVSR